jgi:hypothetical protein
MRSWTGLLFAVLVTLFVACGSSTDSPSTATCAPGATQACLGAGACSGAQSCKDDGSGWNACDCGGTKADTGGGTDSIAGDSVAVDGAEDTSTTTDSSPPSDAPVSAITPDKLPGLALWLDSDKGVTLTADGYNLTKWADQSPAAHPTRIYCGGIGGGTCPMLCGLRKLAADTKGGHDAYQLLSRGKIDCYTFMDSYLTVEDDASLRFGTGPFALFMVVKARDVGGEIDLWGKNSGGAMPNGMTVVLNNTKFEVKTTSAAAKLGLTASAAYRVVVVRGPSLQLRVDGAKTTGTTASDDLSFMGQPMVIGMQLSSGGSTFTTPELALAEYIVVKGAVSDAQVLGVEEYLKTKHKIVF